MRLLKNINILIILLLVLLIFLFSYKSKVSAVDERKPIDRLLDSITDQVEDLNFRLNRIKSLEERMRNVRKKTGLPEENTNTDNLGQEQRIKELEQQVDVLENKVKNCP